MAKRYYYSEDCWDPGLMQKVNTYKGYDLGVDKFNNQGILVEEYHYKTFQELASEDRGDLFNILQSISYRDLGICTYNLEYYFPFMREDVHLLMLYREFFPINEAFINTSLHHIVVKIADNKFCNCYYKSKFSLVKNFYSKAFVDILYEHYGAFIETTWFYIQEFGSQKIYIQIPQA